MPRRYLPHLMTNYTPVLTPKPAPILASITAGETVEIEISFALVPYLLGLLEIYRWPDRFSGDPSDVQNAVGLFQDLRIALTEGNVNHILKFPVDDYNLITAPNGVRGLYIIQQGGEYAFVAANTGANSRVGLFALQNQNNTDEVLLLDRAAQNGDLLRVKPGVGNTYTAINRYGHISTIIHNGNLPAANQYTVGAIIFLLSSNAPSTSPDGPYIGMQVGSSYFWTRFKGDTGSTGGNGTNGTNGINGLPAAMALGSLLTGYPNEDPDVSLSGPGSGNSYLLGFKLPRAATWSKQTDITRYPNEAPTVAVSSDTHGDKLIQFGIPRAATISLNSFLVGLPKDDPDFTLTSDSHGDKLVGVKMPRAQKITTLPTITGAAGTDAGTAYSLDTNGDLVQQHTIPRGQDGISDTTGFKDTPPGNGEDEFYSFLMPASGFHMPFVIVAGTVMKNAHTKGLWMNQSYPFVEQKKPTNGIFTSGTFPHFGDLVAIPDDGTGDTDGAYTYADADAFNIFSGNHVFSQDTRLMFKQHAESVFDPEIGGIAGNVGLGYLMVDFQLARPGVIGLTYGLGSSGDASVLSGEEFDFVLANQGAFYNGSVTFSVPVDLELVSVTGWSQGPYSGATWDFTRANNTYGGYFAAPVDVPDESAKAYGVNSATPCTIRLKATIA